VFAVAVLAFAWQPFGLSRGVAAWAGFAVALVLMLVEVRIRRVAINRLAGGTAGLVLGISLLSSFVWWLRAPPNQNQRKSFSNTARFWDLLTWEFSWERTRARAAVRQIAAAPGVRS